MATDLKLTTYEVKDVRQHSEAGDCYTIICPNCKGRIDWCEHGWWDAICECGIRWSVTVVANGEIELIDEIE